MDDYRYEALKTLTRARFYAVQNLIREKQRFANLLFLKCSGLAQSADTNILLYHASLCGTSGTCRPWLLKK